MRRIYRHPPATRPHHTSTSTYLVYLPIFTYTYLYQYLDLDLLMPIYTYIICVCTSNNPHHKPIIDRPPEGHRHKKPEWVPSARVEYESMSP